MKKFGFGKKDKGDKAGAGGNENPYAANPYAQGPPANDPYDNPNNSFSMPPPQGRPGGLPSGPRGGGGLPSGPRAGGGAGFGGGPAPQQRPAPGGGFGPQSSFGSQGSGNGGYGGNNRGPGGGGSGFRNDNFGAQDGYGGDRYGQGPPPGQGRPGGGYGTGGRSNTDDTDAARDELFGSKRSNPPPQQGGQRPPQQDNRYRNPPPMGANNMGGGGGYGNDDPGRNQLFSGAQDRYDNRQREDNDRYFGAGGGDYGQERELTEEERQELQLQDVKNKTRNVRQDGIDSMNRSLALAAQSLEVGSGTLYTLGNQGERLANSHRNLEKAQTYNKESETQIKDLKRINASMFSGVAKNPFTRGKQKALKEREAMDRARDNDERMEASRQEQFAVKARQDMRAMESHRPNKYDFEVTEKDLDPEYLGEEAEKYDMEQEMELEGQFRQMGFMVGRMNQLARDMGDEVSRQDELIGKTSGLIDTVKTGVDHNSHHLGRIR